MMEEVCGLKGDYVEKWTSFVHIPWVYLGQPMNFSANPHASIKTTKILYVAFPKFSSDSFFFQTTWSSW